MDKNHVHFFQKRLIEIVDGEGTHGFPYHTHESYLIGAIQSGSAKFVCVRQEYLIDAGTAYLVPPNTGMSLTPAGSYSYVTICIKGEMKHRIAQREGAVPVVRGVGSRIAALCERFKQTGLTEEEFLAELGDILGLQNDQTDMRERRRQADVQRAVDYLDEHVANQFDLEALARATHLSKFHLIRLFKQEMGVSPKQYDQQCKIRQARWSALRNEAEVDIAMNLNFSSQSHLCTMFKRYMGISINDYKENVEKKEQ